MAVEEQQRLQGLVLRGGADLAMHRQVSQELLDLGSAKIAGVPSAMKHEITPQPLQVGVLRSQGEMAGAHLLPRHREQTRRACHVLQLPDAQGDTAALKSVWNQLRARRSSVISDVFGVFHHPSSIIYI